MECSQVKMKIDIEDNDLQFIGIDYANLGGIYFSLGDYVRAEECYHKQILIARQIGDKYSLRVGLNNLAGIYDNREDYRRALECYQQSLFLAREMGNRGGERVVLNNMATELSSRGDHQQALAMAEKSLDLARQMGDRRGEAIGLYTLGNIKKDNANYDKALTEYEKAERLFDELSVREYQCECLGALSQTCLLMGNVGSAREYCRQAVALAESLKRSEYLNLLAKIQADINLITGDIGPGEYSARLEPIIPLSPTKYRAEMYLSVFKATGDLKFARTAKEEILSRPGWDFRKDYREWMEYLDKLSV
jgi:tetratricopeptide (TPR) repeat protein